MKKVIWEKIHEVYSPKHLDIINESHKHNVPRDSETHFSIVIVSEKFNGVPIIERHRQVYRLLDRELANGIHALAIHPYTPEEWETLYTNLQSPPCQKFPHEDKTPQI